jgi:hypothetical protein
VEVSKSDLQKEVRSVNLCALVKVRIVQVLYIGKISGFFLFLKHEYRYA